MTRNLAALATAVIILLASCSCALASDRVTVGADEYTRITVQANTYTNSRQESPGLDFDPEGNLVAVWQSRGQDSGTYGVYAQRFDRFGKPLGGEVKINSTVDRNQMLPSIASDSRGAWVAWESYGQDGQMGEVFARRFSPSLAPLTGEIHVNTLTAGEQSDIAVSGDGEGRAVVVWAGPAPRSAAGRIYGRLLSASGKASGPEFRVGSRGLGTESIPGVAMNSAGEFVVVWARAEFRGDPLGIWVQRFGPDGSKAGPEIRVNQAPNRRCIEPAVGISEDGGFVVAWLDLESDGDDYGVMARRFGADGTPLSDEFLVNTTTAGLQNAAVVAFRSDGSFAIAWNSEDAAADGTEILAQFYSPDGRPEGSEFQLTPKEAAGKAQLVAACGKQQAAFGPGAEFALVWYGDAGAGDKNAACITALVPGSPESYSDAIAVAQEANTLRLAKVEKPQTGGQTEEIVAAAEATPHRPPVRTGVTPQQFMPYGGDPDPTPLADYGFLGVIYTGWTPPDPHLACGPEHVIVIVNGGIAFFTKDGTQTFQDEIEDSYGFWGAVGATDFVFDPEVAYDPHSGRFFAMACERGNYSDSYFLLAVSDDSDPNGTWYKWRINVTSLAQGSIDSPNMAIDENLVYLSADSWTPGEVYVMYILDKAPLLSGTVGTTNSFKISGSQSYGMATSYGGAPGLYMIEHFESTTNTKVRLHVITDPLGAANRQTYDVTVPAYGPPEDPPQKGTSTRPETFDARFWTCMWRDGSLWATHHTDSDRVKARWYQIATNGWPNGGTPELVQAGVVDPGADIRTFFTSIWADKWGNAAMCFARSSPNEYISMARCARRFDDPPGYMGDVVMNKVSTGAYTRARWGDYSGIWTDPTDETTFWTHHEYAPGSSSWNTWIASFTAPADETSSPDGFFNPGWNWFSIPIRPIHAAPPDVLGINPSGIIWYWDRYLKAQQVYQPPFVTWDLAVGDGYLLKLTNAIDLGFEGFAQPTPMTIKLGGKGWVWLGMPYDMEMDGDTFMNNVRVQYPVGGEIRTAAEDRASGGPWVNWGWSYWDSELQAAKTFTPYSPFGENVCRPWYGYRAYVNVGSATAEDNPDQVSLIWPER